MKVALVYDRVNKWGGAERVLLALKKIYPTAPLYTSVYDSSGAPWADVFDIRTSFLQKMPFLRRNHEKFALLMPTAFESFSFDEYDLVISLASEAAKGILTKKHTTHICYCLTPTRYLWSGHNEYFKDRLLRTIASPAIAYLRKWDIAASSRPDGFIAISQEVQKRIKKFYGRDASVVYPPIGFEVSKYGKEQKYKGPPFFLVVSRLVAYKRVDLAINACNALQIPLKVIGSGSEEQSLRRLAGPTIEFLGNLTDEELVRYYRDCKGLFFPGTEDFGLTVLEAQLFGKPVLAFGKGGATETVIAGKTGRFFDHQTQESFIASLRIFRNESYDEKECRKNAEKFGEESFATSFRKEVDRILKEKKI